jgi:hypothetical protein
MISATSSPPSFMTAHGHLYMIGRVGSARLLITLNDVIKRGPIWQMILGEGFYSERNGTAMARGLED